MATIRWDNGGEISGTIEATPVENPFDSWSRGFWQQTPMYTLNFGDAEIDMTAIHDGMNESVLKAVPTYEFSDDPLGSFRPRWGEMYIEVKPNGDMILRETPPEPDPDPIDDGALDEFITGGDT